MSHKLHCLQIVHKTTGQHLQDALNDIGCWGEQPMGTEMTFTIISCNSDKLVSEYPSLAGFIPDAYPAYMVDLVNDPGDMNEEEAIVLRAAISKLFWDTVEGGQ